MTPPPRCRWFFAGWMALCAALATAAEDAPPPSVDPTDPQPVELETADGVLLSGLFYRAEEAGKETPIVVMLPDEGEAPSVFDDLALSLQFAVHGEEQPTMSVLAVGLRGQGDSTRVRGPDGAITDRRGAKLTAADGEAMVKRDLEAVRQFLVDKNDAGELNLNRLAYLGVGLGAIVATGGAAVDWEVPILPQGKQGRDVKALVLVSPPWRELGLQMLPALRQPGLQSEVAMLLTYGGESRDARETAERILRQLPEQRDSKPEPEASDEDDLEPAPLRLVDAPGRSRLQGTDWLKQSGRAGERLIARFLNDHVVKPNHPWVQRRLD